jgi:hypothetical protein
MPCSCKPRDPPQDCREILGNLKWRTAYFSPLAPPARHPFSFFLFPFSFFLLPFSFSLFTFFRQDIIIMGAMFYPSLDRLPRQMLTAQPSGDYSEDNIKG